MNYRTTPKHFKAFEGALRAALRDLGMNDWKVYTQHGSKPGSRATCQTRAIKRVATVTLAKVWEEAPTERELTEAARHEGLHVALGQLSCMAENRWVTSDEVELAEEATVQRFLRCVRWTDEEPGWPKGTRTRIPRIGRMK